MAYTLTGINQTALVQSSSPGAGYMKEQFKICSAIGLLSSMKCHNRCKFQ